MATDYTKRSRTFRSVRKMDLARDLDNAFQSVEAEIDDTTSVSASALAVNIAQANWWIDPVSGLDTNTGIAVGQPLKTWKEFERRMSGFPYPTRMPTSITVTILSSWTDETDPITCGFLLGVNGVSLYIVGVPTTVRTGTFTALNQARDNTLNRFWRLADAGVADWTADVTTRRIRITSGAAIGAIGYVESNIGAGVAQFSSFTTATNKTLITISQTDISPIGNETYVIESLPSACIALAGGVSQGTSPIVFENITIGITNTTSIRDIPRVVNIVYCIAKTNTSIERSTVNTYGCLFESSFSLSSFRGCTSAAYGGLLRGTIQVGVGSNMSLGFTNIHTTIVGNVICSFNGVLSLVGPVGVKSTGTAIALSSNGVLTATSGSSGLYGSATTYVITIPPSCSCLATQAAFDRFYAVGTTQDFWCGVQAATVNILDDSVSPPITRSLTQSFANFRAASPNGMNYRCFALNGAASMTINTPTTLINQTANLAQANWWIDPVSGLDSNTGITVGSPLKTWKEFERRFSGLPKLRFTQNMTVNILSSWADDSDPITCDFIRQFDAKYTLIKGTATTVRSGTFTALTQTRDNTLNRFWRLEDTGVADWTSDAGVNRRIRITSGAATGAIAYVKANIGAGVAEFSGFVIVTNPYASSPTNTEVSPVGNETYVVESLTECNPQLSDGVLTQDAAFLQAPIIFENMSIGRSTSPVASHMTFVGAAIRLITCVVPAPLYVYGSTVNGHQTALCGFTLLARAANLTLNTGITRNSIVVSLASLGLGFTNQHVTLLAGVTILGNSYVSLTGPVGVTVTGIAFTLGVLSALTIASGSSGIYGSATTYVLAVPPSASVTGTTGGFDRCYAVGGIQDFWCGVQAATVNVLNDSVSPPLVVAATQSFANLRAAAPAGLGYRCSPIQSNAFIGVNT